MTPHVLIALLASCAAPARPARDTNEAAAHSESDSDTDTDTDTDADADSDFDLVIDRGACDALLDGWTATSASDALAAADLAMIDFYGLEDTITRAIQAAEEGCPSVTETAEGTTAGYVVEGECTTSTGWRYSGRAEASLTFVDGAPQAYSYAWEDFELAHSDGDGDYVVALDGSATEAQQPDSSITLDIDLTQGMRRTGAYAGDGPDFLGVLVGSVTAAYPSFDEDLYVRAVDSDVGVTGDYCVTSRLEHGDCPSEDSGTMTVFGSTVAVLTWDAADCDGCADVTLDGADAGSACP